MYVCRYAVYLGIVVLGQATFILMDAGEDKMDGHCEEAFLTSKCL